jgi:ATP/maltotriose-dependent transcriptional regulator MalT
MPANPLIGREDEIDRVEAFLDGVAQGPSALVLSGEAGIGKTSLWETGVDEARRRHVRVLSCRGVEIEASLSFAVLSELLADVLDETAPSLPPPRRHALEVALLLVEPGDYSPDPYAIGLAVLDVLRVLAKEGPLLVAFDDVQWLDPSSAGALQIAFRRLRDDPVGLLTTVRRKPDAPVTLELKGALPEARLASVPVGPLSPGAIHRLLKERLGLELTRPELTRVQEATAGNPFFALELGRELVRTGERPAPGRALRVPEGLHELLGGRLARLPAETVDVLLLVAALSRATVDLVTAAHGDRERVLAALEAAAGEAVVELDDSRIRFLHPLVASICYEQAPPWKRRAVHRALAGVVHDTEECARHLALAAEGPDPAVALALDSAGEEAAARGATAGAGELLELAAELTEDDPPLTGRRRLRAAHFHRLAGDGERAVAILQRLRPSVPNGAERADVLLELALTRRVTSTEMIELCDEALAEVPGDDARASRILAYRSFSRLFQANVRQGLVDARAALQRAEQVGDPTLLAVAIARVGQAEVWGADITPGLVERGVELEERLGLPLEYYQSPRVAFARLLTGSGQLERGHAIFEELQQRAAERGDEGSRGQILWRLSLAEWYMGRWQQAVDHAAAALEIADQTQDAHQRIFMGRIKALIEVDLGLVDSARSAAEEALRLAEERSDEVNVFTCLGVLGRLELVLGDLEAAGARLRDFPARALSLGYNDPTAPFWEDAIEALTVLGELDRARAYLEPYEQHAARVGDPWAVACAARCRGLLSAAAGDVSAAFAAFDTALTELAGRPYPLERGRTLLSLGTVRRQAQQRKAAREALEQALAIFEELGAPLWAEKARAELARISGRAPSSEELTGTERRVAELAAQGRTNKDIAAELYLGLSTVEAHLSHVYRKLGVRRAGLAGRLADAQGLPAKTGGDAAQT